MKQAAHTQARPVSRIEARLSKLQVLEVAGKKQVLGQAAATQITVRKLEGERNA